MRNRADGQIFKKVRQGLFSTPLPSLREKIEKYFQGVSCTQTNKTRNKYEVRSREERDLAGQDCPSEARCHCVLAL